MLIKLNKDIIILRISGWGQTGLYKDAPGFGSLVEGMSGFASMNGEEGKGPLLPPLALADMVAGLTGFGAILMAILVNKRDDMSTFITPRKFFSVWGRMRGFQNAILGFQFHKGGRFVDTFKLMKDFFLTV